LKNKKSKWITSELSRKTVQKIRYKYDCILTGINTVIADDPLLYPRYAPYNRNNDRSFIGSLRDLNGSLESNPGNSSDLVNSGRNLKLAPGTDFVIKKPLVEKKFFRVILDSGLRISRDSNIVKTASLAGTIIFTGAGKNIDADKEKFLQKAGIDILKVKGTDFITDAGEKLPYLDLGEVLEILYTGYGITSVLVESGPALMAEFIRYGLADKFYFFVAPKIIGGDSPFNMFSSLGISEMDNTFKLEFDKIRKVGGDIFITAYPKRTGPETISG
jgi:diaminohydroxyphosphoribosylaminopyrimidine deaminase/5-amino-6-(5-phosphoribosylamino)uracil reductase